MNSGVRVLLVEDSKVLAERLAEVISQVSHLDLGSTVDTEAAALAVIARESIDVVVLDLHLKLGTGFGVLRGLAGRVPKPLVIVLTNYSLPPFVISGLVQVIQNAFAAFIRQRQSLGYNVHRSNHTMTAGIGAAQDSDADLNVNDCRL
jgi:response regulator of citrate/malate metabolism